MAPIEIYGNQVIVLFGMYSILFYSAKLHNFALCKFYRTFSQLFMNSVLFPRDARVCLYVLSDVTG